MKLTYLWEGAGNRQPVYKGRAYDETRRRYTRLTCESGWLRWPVKCWLLQLGLARYSKGEMCGQEQRSNPQASSRPLVDF